MASATDGGAAERQIARLLEQWADAVCQNNKASIWRNHHPDTRIFDALPPFQYADLQSYRDNWDSWQPPFAGPPQFEFNDLQVCASADVAFAHGVLRCRGRLQNGSELDDRVRATFGFARRDGRWLFVHQHISLPFDAAGSKPGGAD